MNNVSLIGRIAGEINLRFIPGSGKAVANFTLAVNKNLTKDKKAEFEQKGQPTADFIRCVVWGKQAENVANYMTKGKMIAVNGSIQTGSYKDNNGETRYTTDVLCGNIEFIEYKSKTENDQSDFGDYQTVEDDDFIPF